MFRETIAEYKSEGIDVAVIGYRDNDAQLKIVDGRPMGILALLEEECFVPRGNDLGFINKLEEHFGGGRHALFTRPKVRSNAMDLCFTVRHYAAEVTYNAKGWLEKSRGAPPSPRSDPRTNHAVR